MNLKRQVIQVDGLDLPCVKLTPSVSHGAAVIIHGYGGCKEEQLGLAWRVAERSALQLALLITGDMVKISYL